MDMGLGRFWELVMDREVWRPAIHGDTKSRTRLSDFTFGFVAAVVQSQSHVRLCNRMDCSTPGSSVLHCLPEFIQFHVHRVSDAVELPHPLLPPSPIAFSFFQHQDLF